MRSQLVILDANVIIDAHKMGLWKHLTSQYRVQVPSTVLREEARFFKNRYDQQVDIDLQTNLSAGQIQEIEATAEELEALTLAATSSFLRSIDEGETEAIAILRGGRFKESVFCTGDQLAIKAISVFELSDQAVSFERLLNDSGSSIKCLPRHYSEERLKKLLVEGFQERELYRQ